jgi:hypothetical protein
LRAAKSRESFCYRQKNLIVNKNDYTIQENVEITSSGPETENGTESIQSETDMSDRVEVL